MSDISRPFGTEELRWLDAGLRFKCTGCGKCCTGASGSVYVSKPDLERLAGFLKLQPGKVARTYTRVVRGRRVLIDQTSHDCIFLNGKTCSVYDGRPTQCRAFPWWLTNIRDADSWTEAAKTCEGIDHPDAALVPASEILAQCQQDLDNESTPSR